MRHRLHAICCVVLECNLVFIANLSTQPFRSDSVVQTPVSVVAMYVINSGSGTFISTYWLYIPQTFPNLQAKSLGLFFPNMFILLFPLWKQAFVVSKAE